MVPHLKCYLADLPLFIVVKDICCHRHTLIKTHSNITTQKRHITTPVMNNNVTVCKLPAMSTPTDIADNLSDNGTSRLKSISYLYWEMNELRETTWLVKRLARVGRTMGLLSRKKEPDWLRMGLLWLTFAKEGTWLATVGLTLGLLWRNWRKTEAGSQYLSPTRKWITREINMGKYRIMQ